MNLPNTPGPWNSECVSDHCRVFVGSGRRKIVLARLAPKQLPESESAVNGRLMAAAPELLEFAKGAQILLRFELSADHPLMKAWEAIRIKLEGTK